jgi:hypothetical protein
LDPNASLLVIDGSITDEPGPYFVKLSKSIDIGNTNGNLFLVGGFLSIIFALVKSRSRYR